MNEYFVVEPCTTSNAFEIKLKEKKLDLKKCESAITIVGEVVASMPVVMVAKVEDYSLSLYASGRIMVKSAKKLRAKHVEEFAKKLMAVLEKAGAII